jgi:hypothetical protein
MLDIFIILLSIIKEVPESTMAVIFSSGVPYVRHLSKLQDEAPETEWEEGHIAHDTLHIHTSYMVLVIHVQIRD